MSAAAERAAAGRAARSVARRSAHAEWAPPATRTDPVAIIEAHDARRVPGLVPVRHWRMAASPFAFYRGAAAVMAADLATTPVSGLRAQACGDAQPANFGAFAAPDGRLVFDLDDFDETLPGPWEWDLKRLTAGFALAGRDLGFKRSERSVALLAAAHSYREAMRGFAAEGDLAVWHERLDVEESLGRLEGADPGSVKRVERRTPSIEEPAPDATESSAEAEAEASLREVLLTYRSTLPGDGRHLLDGFQFRRIARQAGEVGSLGTRAWVILLTGRDDEDPLFLQAKEAEASVLEPYAGPSRFRNHGRRVVEGQRLLQAAGDVFLGWCVAVGIDGRDRDFYVRRLWDRKRSVEVEGLTPPGLEAYAELCGWTLARAHARSGDRIGIASYLGGGDSFDRAICAFSELCADQTERDHAALCDAIDSGRLESTPDP
jgi:uncharacterized protein (DUF2252 family)